MTGKGKSTSLSYISDVNEFHRKAARNDATSVTNVEKLWTKRIAMP
jgi:hypothetical protein